MTKTFELDLDLVKSIKPVDVAFGSTILLPPEESIPKEFFGDNLYTQLVSCIFYSKPMPDFSIELKHDLTIDEFKNAINSHIGSFEPEHCHKMAGVAYLMSLMCELKNNQAEPVT